MTLKLAVSRSRPPVPYGANLFFVCICDDSIIPRTDVPWHRVYEFVFDRLRAVRQDMVIQRIGGNAAVWILERCVRFLIYTGYRLDHDRAG